ncbi:hypothetical protein BN59_01492 [Legionella massiliensis]|uniref:Uncharacterized protein n=1 Tax=Legionella massiliensis TaxID=1034943 RepID=A0A078KRX4_9GAMM|nr:hypothetical protein BN59_01492 [Legionella massiliensis]CEE12948.1 hypothetical protein BN1094_01492 [Legionella massiliensis]
MQVTKNLDLSTLRLHEKLVFLISDCNSLILMVARDRIELSTQGFINLKFASRNNF